MTPDEARAKLLELGARNEGVCLKEITDHGNVWERAEELVRAGRLFKAKISHRVVRYFTDARMAAALAEKPNLTISKSVVKAGFSPKDPPIITANTKVTICPSPRDFHVKQFSRW